MRWRAPRAPSVTSCCARLHPAFRSWRAIRSATGWRRRTGHEKRRYEFKQTIHESPMHDCFFSGVPLSRSFAYKLARPYTRFVLRTERFA
jgi:hypothetical protein